MSHWRLIRDDGVVNAKGEGKAVYACTVCGVEWLMRKTWALRGDSVGCRNCAAEIHKKPPEKWTVLTKHKNKQSLTQEETAWLAAYGKISRQRRALCPKSRAGMLVASARNRARMRHIPCDISSDWVLEKLELGVCEATGVALDLGPQIRSKYAPSLDQIEPGRGYTLANTRVVALIFNNLKNNYPDSDVWAFIEEAYERRHRA